MFKKIILPGMLAGVTMLAMGFAVGALFSGAFPALKSEYANTLIFRPMNDPLMMLYFIHPFFLCIVLAWIWDSTKIIFSGKSTVNTVLRFAFFSWLVSFSGMLISYSTFQVSFVIVVSWTVSIFFESIVASFVFVKMSRG